MDVWVPAVHIHFTSPSHPYCNTLYIGIFVRVSHHFSPYNTATLTTSSGKRHAQGHNTCTALTATLVHVNTLMSRKSIPVPVSVKRKQREFPPSKSTSPKCRIVVWLKATFTDELNEKFPFVDVPATLAFVKERKEMRVTKQVLCPGRPHNGAWRRRSQSLESNQFQLV